MLKLGSIVILLSLCAISAKAEDVIVPDKVEEISPTSKDVIVPDKIEKASPVNNNKILVPSTQQTGQPISKILEIKGQTFCFTKPANEGLRRVNLPFKAEKFVSIEGDSKVLAVNFPWTGDSTNSDLYLKKKDLVSMPFAALFYDSSMEHMRLVKLGEPIIPTDSLSVKLNIKGRWLTQETTGSLKVCVGN